MCYVHNQWYDISCATLYFVQHTCVSNGTARHTLLCVRIPQLSQRYLVTGNVPLMT